MENRLTIKGIQTFEIASETCNSRFMVELQDAICILKQAWHINQQDLIRNTQGNIAHMENF